MYEEENEQCSCVRVYVGGSECECEWEWSCVPNMCICVCAKYVRSAYSVCVLDKTVIMSVDLVSLVPMGMKRQGKA